MTPYREAHEVEGGGKRYLLNIDEGTRTVIRDTLARYEALITENELSDKVREQLRGQRSWDIFYDKFLPESQRKEIAYLREILKIASEEVRKSTGGRRNAYSGSRENHRRRWYGKDSQVYSSWNRLYVYKESVVDVWFERLEYLRKKYLVLKKYLGSTIPKSFFIESETLEDAKAAGIRDNLSFRNRVVTVQRKVEWKTAAQMTEDERNDPEMREHLQRAHHRYILLKMFIQRLISNAGGDRKVFDISLDLGPLSDADHISPTDIDATRNLTSPNIMWDWKEIFFIDFGAGEWGPEKETIFQELMKEDTLKRWNAILENME